MAAKSQRPAESNGESGEKNVERDLVWRFLPFRTLYQGDHSIQKSLARVGRNFYFDVIR